MSDLMKNTFAGANLKIQRPTILHWILFAIFGLAIIWKPANEDAPIAGSIMVLVAIIGAIVQIKLKRSAERKLAQTKSTPELEEAMRSTLQSMPEQDRRIIENWARKHKGESK